MADDQKPAEKPAEKPAAKGGPKKVQMHRTVHELVTGTKPENVVPAGEIVTDELAKEHKLSAKDLEALTDKGALELVEVLKD